MDQNASSGPNRPTNSADVSRAPVRSSARSFKKEACDRQAITVRPASDGSAATPCPRRRQRRSNGLAQALSITADKDPARLRKKTRECNAAATNPVQDAAAFGARLRELRWKNSAGSPPRDHRRLERL